MPAQLCMAAEPRVLRCGQGPSESTVKALFLEHVDYQGRVEGGQGGKREELSELPV